MFDRDCTSDNGHAVVMMFKARLYFRVLAGIAVASVCMSAVAWFVWPSSPSMALSTGRLDLGDGKPGAKMRGIFQIRNGGSRPLEYQIQSTCGCTELTPRSGTVDPGGSQDVSVALTLPEYAGSEQSVKVLVKCNDPHRPAATCSVTAKCPAPFEATPKFVNLGEVIRDDLGLVSEVLEIRGSGGKVLDNPGRLRLRHESQHIQINQELTADGVIRLKISLSPQTPCIELYDTLELRLGNSSDRVVKVPMHARVVEPVYVVPSTVFLRIDPLTGKYQPVDLLVISRCPGITLGPVSVSNDRKEEVNIEDDTPLDATRRRMRLVVLSKLITESEMSVSLKCEGVDSLCVLKVVDPRIETE